MDPFDKYRIHQVIRQMVSKHLRQELFALNMDAEISSFVETSPLEFQIGFRTRNSGMHHLTVRTREHT